MEFTNNTDLEGIVMCIGIGCDTFIIDPKDLVSFISVGNPYDVFCIISEYGTIVLTKESFTDPKHIQNNIYKNFGSLVLSFNGTSNLIISADPDKSNTDDILREKYKKARKKAKRFKRKYLELRSILENGIKSK